MRAVSSLLLSAAALAALAPLPAAAQTASGHLDEARCLGVYEAGYFIFDRISQMGTAAGAGVLIANAAGGAAKMSYEQTIDTVLAADDMTDAELMTFRETHLTTSDSLLARYAEGELDLFGAGQLIYNCDVLLGYVAAEQP